MIPFAYRAEDAGCGQLFCFELDPAQSRSIEPCKERFLGALLFSGREETPERENAQTITLPAGRYLFCQERNALNRDECIELALEQQKDGLWERLKLKPLLYIRYLFEDEKAVTQIMRPYDI
jgi:hypothetical protein